ncbi:hypothetical protein Tco_0162009 [Tanacetum coccineum]
MGAHWKEQLCLGPSKEAKESNLSDLCGYSIKHKLFRAFTASASVLAIYIQQFCNTLTYEAKTKAYSFQLDESQFVLDDNLLREALEITPIDQAHQFVSPPSGDAIMDFVNELGYTKEIYFVSRMAVNNLYQPWRAILSMINQCLTSKTSGSESSLHLTEEDLRLGNLKFVPKGEDNEVFGMPIPNELITNNIRNAPYYNAYMEMVAKHDWKIVVENEGKKKPVTAKQLKPKPVKEKLSKPTPASKPKVTKEKPSKPSLAKHPKRGKVQKLRKGKNPLQLINKDEPTQPEPEPKHHEPVAGPLCPLPVVRRKGEKAIATEEHVHNPADEHVILEDPLSSSETLSSMKNLDDAYIIGDQFLNDKSTEDELKLNMEAELVSMVTVPIYQASSSVPPLSTPVIDLSPPKLQNSNNLDNTTQNLGSRVLTLELRDLPHKINQMVNEVVKEAVHVALQAPLRDRFRELPEADMKEILHQRMFESDTYKSLPEHVALYEALEASMERANKDEFFAKKDKSRKRCRNDHDPPPPPPDLDPSKKRRHDSDASGSSQPPTPQSSAWKTSDSREAPSRSSKQQSGPYSEQPVEDVPMPDTTHISDLEDIDFAYLPKIKSRPEWLKPIPEEDRPTTLEPD